VRNRIVNLSGAKPGDKVLDVATGTGKQAFAFAKSGCDVIGIDITEGMLRVARKHNTYKNLSFRQADATSLPFQDNTFDITSIAFALHEMPSVVREKALLEMVRVTMPDGVIIISITDYRVIDCGASSYIISLKPTKVTITRSLQNLTLLLLSGKLAYQFKSFRLQRATSASLLKVKRYNLLAA